MRIVVEPSDFDLGNTGDIAMLHVAITRLAALWPHASIQVFSRDPDRFSAFCPDATPILFEEARVHRRWQPVVEILRRSPALFALLRRVRPKNRAGARRYPAEVVDAISRADLMVVSGMGGVTDAFRDYAIDLLERLDLALQAGIPVVMVGQGIGPLRDPALRAKAEAILPRIAFISLREGLAGYPLLRSLGVSSDRIMTTGDDAIEMAYSLRSARLGSGLGINLRLATYSAVDQQLVAEFRQVLQDVARLQEATLVSTPISYKRGEADADTIRQIMSGYEKRSEFAMDASKPFGVMDNIKNCRVVISGSYHGAVFALSQGIPTVGIANNEYYIDKFLGLADQFGKGCEIIILRDSDWRSKLAATLDRVWQSADEVRPQLLAAAARQVALSQAAYQKIYNLITFNGKHQKVFTTSRARVALDDRDRT
jgi:polysaccharide pyruvyl transferase WcaK-like protein